MTSEQHTPLPAEMTDEHEPPRGRLLRLPEVIGRVGMSRSTIYQRMSEGRFPKSRSLGPKCAVWIEAEIDDWVSQVASL
jgi:prophage regulatory protein